MKAARTLTPSWPTCSLVDDCASKVEILPLRTAGAMIGEVMQCKETAAVPEVAVWYLCDNEMLQAGQEEFAFLQALDIPSEVGYSLLKLRLALDGTYPKNSL